MTTMWLTFCRLSRPLSLPPTALETTTAATAASARATAPMRTLLDRIHRMLLLLPPLLTRTFDGESLTARPRLLPPRTNARKSRRAPRGALRWNDYRASAGLLELDGGAGLFELRLDRIGLFLIHALLDGARG